MNVGTAESSVKKRGGPSPGRQVIAACVGNAVEWFDWYIYSILAIYFAHQFFPADESSLVPLMAALAIFAVGFFARPLGGLIFGTLTDRLGRKRALTMTVAGMGMGSLLIAIAPTYAQVGLFAPLTLLIARIIQGLSAGGEYGAATAFIIESAPDKRRGLYSGFLYGSAVIANMAAIGLSVALTSVLTDVQMASWGWRVPFLLGSAAALVAIWVRKNAAETLPAPPAEKTTRPGIRLFDFFREHPKQSLQVFAMTAAPAVVFYVWSAYLPTYAKIAVGFDLDRGLLISLFPLPLFLVLHPLFGMLSDKIGRKPLAITFGVFFTLGTVPLLASLQPTLGSFLIVQITGLVFIACWTSISSAVAAELFPARLRGSGIGFPYALSVAIFGGTGPYLATYLVDLGEPLLFAWYISALALIGTVVLIRLPETARRPLS